MFKNPLVGPAGRRGLSMLSGMRIPTLRRVRLVDERKRKPPRMHPAHAPDIITRSSLQVPVQAAQGQDEKR